MAEKAIYSRLSGYAGLTALTSTRIYPLIAPQNVTAPFVVFERVSSVRVSAMGADTGIVRARVTVSSYGTSYDSAKSVANQVRAALQRFSGTEASIVVQQIFIDNEFDDYDDDTKLRRVIQDYEVIYGE